MKVVINRCFGGFSLSRAAVKRMAELQGRPCFFFTHARDAARALLLDTYEPVAEGGEEPFMWSAFDIPNPNDGLASPDAKTWAAMTMDERQAYNARYTAHSFDTRPDTRHDPLLIQVVEELGDAANGSCAKLAVVEIPDGTDYEISEYDGNEHIAEKHRTWS